MPKNTHRYFDRINVIYSLTMVIDVKLRLYDFPSKVGSGLQSIACKGVDIAGKILLDQISQLLNVSSERLSG